MAKNTNLIKNISFYLHKHLFGIDPDAGEDFLTNGAFSVFMSPGQFLSPNWQEGNLEHMHNQAALLDEVMSAAFIYTPQIGNISGQYKHITADASLPISILTKDQEIELTRLGKIVEDGKANYETYKDWYYDAFEAYEAERILQTPNQGRLARLLNAKNDAWRDWNNPVKGKKSQIDRANADIAAIYRGSPRILWAQLEDLLRNSERQAHGVTFYETRLLPPVSTWNDSSWSNFSKTISETEVHNYSKIIEWSGSLGARWGLFNSVNVGANGQKTVSHEESDITTINVVFDYMRVRINRDWLDQNVFNYKFWTWVKSVQTGLLSDGGDFGSTPPKVPIGDLPFLPTSLIAVRNVVITADFKSSDITKINSQISGGASAGFGPFSVRGSYTETTNQLDVRADFDGTSLKIPNPQVLGFQGVLLPKSPNPDKTLPFDWNIAWDPSADQAFLEILNEKRRVQMLTADAIQKYDSLKGEVFAEADIKLHEKYDEYLKNNGL